MKTEEAINKNRRLQQINYILLFYTFFYSFNMSISFVFRLHLLTTLQGTQSYRDLQVKVRRSAFEGGNK